MRSTQLRLDLSKEIIVDLFAGGGGMSTAVEQALGRSPDIAINHDDDALSMHRSNHPQTRHFIADVWEVCPRGATRGRPVGLLHLSPDCRDFSQAKGGQPRKKKIRALSWVGKRWAGQVRPRTITLENVTAILRWSPLIAKRDKATGRVVKLDGTVAAPGERVPVQEQYLMPDPKRAGQTWRRFVSELRALGYAVEWKILCAADYGAPTTRERLFMVARCDGEPIRWPDPTHFKNLANGQKKWRAAAECIDWSIPCPSIFTRKKPLAEATLRRIAKGIRKYVLDSASPFIVPIAHYNGRDPTHPIDEPLRTVTAHPKGGSFALATPMVFPATHQGADRVYGIEDPLRTITAAHRGEFMLAAPVLVQTGYGERAGQAPRALDIDAPLGTVVAGGCKHALVSAFLAQMNGGFNETPGHDARRPMSTITNRGSQQQLVTAHLATLRHHSVGRAADEPVPTLAAGGEHHAVVAATLMTNPTGHAGTDLRDPRAPLPTGQPHALLEHELPPEIEAGALRVAAFLVRYYGEGGQWSDPRDPTATITTRDRLALVTVMIRGTPYVIVDIGLRMLTPRELYVAQGFPTDYIIERGHDGRKFSKSAQVRMCGNSVSPPPAIALIAANAADLAIRRPAAAYRAQVA